MNFSQVRDHYPALRVHTYLNTASCGIISEETARIARQFYQDLLQQGGVPRGEWYEQISAVRMEVARWLGARAEEIALLPNFSIASNFVARALPRNSRVLLLKNDYPSLTLPWLLPKNSLYYLEPETNGFFDLNRIDEQVKTHSINVLAISHVQYTTGFCVDLHALSACCRDWGVLLVVDATQSLGIVPIDLQKTPVDILMASGYKWLSAGFGNAVLFIRREWHERLSVAAVGYNSFDDFSPIEAREEIDFMARTLEVGHYDFSSFFALQQAVKELQAVGSEAIARRVQALTTYLHQRLPTMARVVSDYPEEYRSGITVIEGDAELEKALLNRGVVTSARAGGLRISLHFYNNEADIDRLCEVLAQLL